MDEESDRDSITEEETETDTTHVKLRRVALKGKFHNN